ncbi:hemicentin-1 isoform X2 [Cimex lectularius]|uniref:Ig-like domain-containing protein n=1 Tax=Cimex lectularius TaxID=79782 RepID=A0A8I6SNP8_CIMLE|nr:hemicentin-1 isoform X2 [Cimex lectularius]
MMMSKLEYEANKTQLFLLINKVELEDEGMYQCEINYIIESINEDCNYDAQFINFTTLIKPEFITIEGDGKEITNGSKIGPLTEDDEITLTCSSGGAKPIPTIQWYNGTTLLEGECEEEKTDGLIGTNTNKVKIRVSRGDLGIDYQCRALHPTIAGYISKEFQFEVNVRPNNLEMSPVNYPIIKGNKVHLTCTVKGARPAANITWYNGTTALQETESEVKMLIDRKPYTKKIANGDNTFDTVSQLVFIATRFENEQSLSCEASNEIMRSRHEGNMRETTTLEVMYPPIVTVAPENITVNETTDILIFCQYEANPSTLVSVKWMRDEEEVILEPDHYQGGTTEHTALLIKNSTRYDIGSYTCILANEIGAMPSHNSVNVSVYFKPIVNVSLSPPSPVTEVDNLNITLTCNVIAGNPDTLKAVRWYLNGQLLKELPDCSDSTFCNLDPSMMLLEEVGRNFHGNYSCIGMNDAGWGPISPEAELAVYYPPSAVTLKYTPSSVVKRGSMTLMCSVGDLGRPANTTYRWMRGAHIVFDVTTANWTIDPVTLETQSNFTCAAVNLGGESESATVFVNVFAPPTFIERLPLYYGALMTSQSISITCRVECYPVCSITWQKNGQRLETGSRSRYYVISKVEPPDTRTNDFQSVKSTLIWNMTAWPGGVLDRMTDNANYSCESTGNAVGSGVKSTMFFGVEYPPENMTVSNSIVNVTEGNIPEKILCSAKAYPEATYQWRREGENEVVMKGNALIVNHAVLRRNAGNYTCEAQNRHGNNTKTIFINVLYRPECGITKKEVEGKLVLICQALANPAEVDFTWKIKNENETIEDNIEKNGLQSLLTLETRVESFRTYLCFANNSVGMSIPCEMDVTGSISWWGKLEKENLMILIAIIAGIILMVIIICIIIIIVCRRKRAADKFMIEHEPEFSPEGSCTNNNNNNPGGASTPTNGHVSKWPMRPGVLVHVNNNHSLLSSAPSGRSPNESQASRTSRIKAMFSQDPNTQHFPGVFQSKSGVVTFKRLDSSSENNTLVRQQKKPDITGPNPSSNKDINSSHSNALLPPDPDKAFYENLPFHNIQNPPNKASRPPSRISSGYGSARSQKALRPARKFLTVRPLGTKPRNWPQFRSLRISKAKNSLPVPAPRVFFPKKPPINHSYQNVPPPKDLIAGSSESPAEPKPSEPKETENPTKENAKDTSCPRIVLAKEKSVNSKKDVHKSVPPHNDIQQNTKDTQNEEEKDNKIRSNDAKESKENLTPINKTPDRTEERIAYGENGGRHHSHGRSSTGGRTKRKQHRRSEMECPRYRPGSAPGSPPSNRYLPPDNPPLPQLVYQAPPRSHHTEYSHPRNKTDYTFIKFHDVGQEIDV